MEASSTWKAADNLIEGRRSFGAVSVPRRLICPPEDSLLFITGGSGGSYLSSTEVYPSTRGCSPPPLPLERNSHTTFVTSEPSALVATCGGYDGSYTSSCLVLDTINQRWDESRMGSLTMGRLHSAVATFNDIGVFIVGGGNTNKTSQ